jgi:hypothetical protein
MGSKTFSLRDKKSFITNKSNLVEFINETYKHKKELCTIYKNCQNFAPFSLFNAQMTPQKNTRDSDRNCFYVFCQLSRKLNVFDPICIKSFMPIFDHRIRPDSVSVEF